MYLYERVQIIEIMIENLELESVIEIKQPKVNTCLIIITSSLGKHFRTLVMVHENTGKRLLMTNSN